MEQKLPVRDGSAAPYQKPQSRHITPSLPPFGGGDNTESSCGDDGVELLACFVFVFKVKGFSGNKNTSPFRFGQLPLNSS
jgi:hypothetical protein